MLSLSTFSSFADDRIPSCPSSVVAVGKGDNNAITVTWQQPPNTPPVTSTTVTYCPTSSPNCGNSINCASPCTISGLDPGTEYQFTVIPNNNCGSPTGCTGNTATVEIACECSHLFVSESDYCNYQIYVVYIPPVQVKINIMSNMYSSVMSSSITFSWHHTNCCTLVGQHHQCGGGLPHNKTLLQEGISEEFSFKR